MKTYIIKAYHLCAGEFGEFTVKANNEEEAWEKAYGYASEHGYEADGVEVVMEMTETERMEQEMLDFFNKVVEDSKKAHNDTFYLGVMTGCSCMIEIATGKRIVTDENGKAIGLKLK